MRNILLLVFLAACYNSFAQSYDDKNAVALPSPNNDFTNTASNIDVSLYTGKPDINIPLYSLRSKEVSIPVSLTYVSANGVKVQDVADFVGLGWQLNAGGYISRIVRGLADESTNGYIGTNHAGQTIKAGITNDLVTKIGKGELDGEPDIFHLSTPFFSVNFVLDENGNPVFPNNTGLAVTHNLYNNSKPDNTWWIITDDKGNKYYFSYTSGARENLTTKLFDDEKSFVTAWYLDKIVTFNSKETINFEYVTGPDYIIKGYDVSYTYLTVSGPCSVSPNELTSDIIRTNTFKTPKYISRIVSSLGEVSFNYDFSRQDISNAAKLNTIIVKAYEPGSYYSNTTVKKYEFSYSYFGSGGDEALRLKLDYINLYGTALSATPLKFKSFTYYMAANLPARNSVEFDYWGYYNTNNSGTAIVPAANKEPDYSRTKANILTAIQDVAGGITQFDYQLNSFYDNASAGNKPAGGVRVSRITEILPSGAQTFTDYVYEDAAGKSTGQIYNATYKNFSKTIYVTILGGGGQFCLLTGKNTTAQAIYNSFDLNGNFVGYSSVKIVNQNGGYEIDQFTNFNDFPDVFNYTTSNGSVYGYADARQLSAATSLSYKRGLLRFKTQYKSNGDPVSETENVYTSLTPVTPKATGVRATALNYLMGTSITSWVYGAYNNNVENYQLTKTINKTFDQANRALYQEKITDYTYTASQRLILETVTTDTKGSTRTEKNFYPEDALIPNVTPDEQVAIDSLRKANRTGVPVHTIETLNGTSLHTHYSYKKTQDIYLKPVILLEGTTSYVNNNLAEGQVKRQQYGYDAASLNLTSTSSTSDPVHSMLYGYNNSLITAEVSNAVNKSTVSVLQQTAEGWLVFYPNDSWQQSETIDIGYVGNVTISIEFDYVGSTSMQSSIDYYLSGPANYSGTLCISNNNTCYYGSSVTLENVLPGRYTLTAIPNTSSEYPAYANVNFKFSYPQNVGNYNYLNEFFYEGFETNWYGSSADPCAGKKCNWGDYSVPFTKPNGRAYQVDYHYYLDGKWYSASKTYENYMVLTEGSAIDEVRVYPKDATMKTFNYDPLIGMTSQCDENNRITYYEYDDLARLVLTRDQDKNVTKKICYTYSGQPDNCTFIGNDAQTQTFTRNNCGMNALGTQVPYTVAANTFYSAVSKEDANQKAKNYLAANGQDNANRIGSCTPIFWNEERSRYFTPQNCGPGTTPDPYLYTVYANKYYSFNNVEEANQMADHEIDVQGQEDANRYGHCTPITVSVQYNVSDRVYGYRVRFTNAYTGQEYDFELPYGEGTLPSIPIGTYDVYIYDTYQLGYYYSFELCGFYEYGTEITYYGYTISPDCATIRIY